MPIGPGSADEFSFLPRISAFGEITGFGEIRLTFSLEMLFSANVERC
jgi:hypothetical protein